MIPTRDDSVSLMGYWNRMIFTPEWVGSELFEGAKLSVQVPVMPVDPIIFSNSLAELHVSTGRLIFKPLRGEASSYLAVEKLAKRVLILLDDTPVTGVAFRFTFTENTPSKIVVSLFQSRDEEAIRKAGWTTPGRRLVRQLVRSDLMRINLSITETGDGLSIVSNSYYDVRSHKGRDALERLEVTGVLSHRTACVDLLDRVYRLKFEESVING